MIIPNAVKKAAERSEAIQKQLAEGKPQENPQGTTPQPGAQPEDGTPNDGRDTSQTDVVSQQTPQPADTSNPPANPEPSDPPKEDEETYKQRYFTLKGKFDAQVPRMNQDIRNLQQVVSDLQTENNQLKEAATKHTQPDTTENTEIPELDKDKFKEYGDEFGSLVETVQALQNENKNLKAQMSQVSGDMTKEREAKIQENTNQYYAAIEKQIADLGADFDALNHDQKFLNWLRQFPEGQIESRHSLLQKAEKALDLNATMAIWKEYLGKPDPQPQPTPTPTPPNIQPTPLNTGTDLNPPVAQQSTKQWTRKAIGQFYRDKSAGVFKGKEEEAAALEQDIYLAQTQGRIVA